MIRTSNAAVERHRSPWPLRPTAAVVLLAFAGAAQAAPDIRTDDDYIAIVLEAEDSDPADERWVVTRPDTATQEGDDSNHADGASGGTYLELLPDTRIDDEDELIQTGPDANYWDTAGTGPSMTWTVDVPEAGRWYAHIRSYSTGTEDNGAHMGIDDTWPPSGRRFQACIAGGGWQWRSHQRDSGGVGSCGVSHTIWLDVDEAGEHRIQLGAREDGFEVDRIMLIRDLSENTRICQPSGTDDIACRNGSLGGPDELVDLAVSLEGGRLDGEATDRYRVTATVENLDDWDIATNTTLAIALGDHFELTGNDDGCTFDGAGLTCPIGALQPTGPEDARTFTFEVEATGEDVVPTLEASVASDVDEERTENDSATFDGERTGPALVPALTARLVAPADGAVANGSVALMALVDNAGTGAASDVRVTIGLPDWMSAGTLPAQCTAGRPIECSVDALAAGAQAAFAFEVTAARAGVAALTLATVASDVVEPVSANLLLNVAEAEPEVTPEEVVPEVVPEPETPVPDENDEDEKAKRSGGGGGAPGALLIALAGVAVLRRRR